MYVEPQVTGSATDPNAGAENPPTSSSRAGAKLQSTGPELVAMENPSGARRESPTVRTGGETIREGRTPAYMTQAGSSRLNSRYEHFRTAEKVQVRIAIQDGDVSDFFTSIRTYTPKLEVVETLYGATTGGSVDVVRALREHDESTRFITGTDIESTKKRDDTLFLRVAAGHPISDLKVDLKTRQVSFRWAKTHLLDFFRPWVPLDRS